MKRRTSCRSCDPHGDEISATGETGEVGRRSVLSGGPFDMANGERLARPRAGAVAGRRCPKPGSIRIRLRAPVPRSSPQSQSPSPVPVPRPSPRPPDQAPGPHLQGTGLQPRVLIAVGREQVTDRLPGHGESHFHCASSASGHDGLLAWHRRPDRRRCLTAGPCAPYDLRFAQPGLRRLPHAAVMIRHGPVRPDRSSTWMGHGRRLLTHTSSPRTSSKGSTGTHDRSAEE